MSDNAKELVVVPARHMGQTIEMIKRLRPDIVIQESDCQQQHDALLAACEIGLAYIKAVKSVPRPISDFQEDKETVEAAIAAAK